MGNVWDGFLKPEDKLEATGQEASSQTWGVQEGIANGTARLGGLGPGVHLSLTHCPEQTQPLLLVESEMRQPFGHLTGRCMLSQLPSQLLLADNSWSPSWGLGPSPPGHLRNRSRSRFTELQAGVGVGSDHPALDPAFLT